MDWLHITIRTNMATGIETVSYNYTPEAFVERLQREQDVIHITDKACPDCFYFNKNLGITKEMLEKHAREFTHYHRCMECIGGAVARRMGRRDVPGFVGCYTFFYKHYATNIYIKAAMQARLLSFYDVTKLPTLKDVGGTITLPNWYY